MRRGLVVCVLAAACGSSGGGGPIPIESLQASYNAYYCNLAVRCGLVSDLLTCGKLDLNAPTISPDLVAAVEAGTVIYDGAAAETCLAGITATCDQSLVLTNRNAPAACEQMFTGTVAANGPCALDQECVSQVCSSASCSTTGQPLGYCIGDAPPARPVVGDSCNTNSNCLDSYCDTTTYTCSPLLSAGASCSSNDWCQLGLACHNGTCAALAATGGACTSTSDCRSIGDYCGAMAKCTPYGLAGDTCTTASECSGVYRCDSTSGTCVLRPETGQMCGSSPLNCVDRSYCDGTTGTCTAPAPDGTLCTSSSQCESGYCDFSTTMYTCRTKPLCY